MFKGKVYPAKLVDLPCIIESQKTFDRVAYYKSGDISQMLLVHRPEETPPADQMSSGITPPTAFIRDKRFRKRPYSREEVLKTEKALLQILEGRPQVTYELVEEEYEVDEDEAYSEGENEDFEGDDFDIDSTSISMSVEPSQIEIPSALESHFGAPVPLAGLLNQQELGITPVPLPPMLESSGQAPMDIFEEPPIQPSEVHAPLTGDSSCSPEIEEKRKQMEYDIENLQKNLSRLEEATATLKNPLLRV